MDRFAGTVDDYRAQVFRLPESEIGSTVLGVLNEGVRGVEPVDLLSAWVQGVSAVPDTGLSVDDLGRVDAVMTGCRVEIFATGPIVLDASLAHTAGVDVCARSP